MTATAAITERDHVHDEVAEKLGLDVDQLRAEIADAIREPFTFGGDDE